jgi:hypothetical protein
MPAFVQEIQSVCWICTFHKNIETQNEYGYKLAKHKQHIVNDPSISGIG